MMILLECISLGPRYLKYGFISLKGFLIFMSKIFGYNITKYIVRICIIIIINE